MDGSTDGGELSQQVRQLARRVRELGGQRDRAKAMASAAESATVMMHSQDTGVRTRGRVEILPVC